MYYNGATIMVLIFMDILTMTRLFDHHQMFLRIESHPHTHIHLASAMFSSYRPLEEIDGTVSFNN